MNPVTAKVEIRFDGSTWVDVTDVAGVNYLYLAAGVQIVRGRDDETGDPINVGTCSFTLVNDDGRFTPGLSTSPYYPYVVEGVAVRVSAWANSAWRVRFYGLIQSWAVSWVDAATSFCAVTANDMLGAFPSYTFRQASDELIRNLPGVLYHWPLRELSGDAAPLIGDVLLVDNGGTESLPGGLLELDEGTDEHPTFVSSSGKRKLTSGTLKVPETHAVFAVVMSAPTANGSIISVGSGFNVEWSTADGFYWTGYSSDAVMPTAWPALVLVVPSGAALSVCSYGGGLVSTLPIMVGPEQVTQIVVNPTLSGGSTWPLGHVFIQGDVASVTAARATQLALAQTLLAPRISPVTPAANQILALASSTVTLTGATVGEATLPTLGDRDAADAMGALVTGMGARLVDNLDGTLLWIPFAPGTTAVAPPAGEVDPSMTWATSNIGWMSDCTVTWPDGTSYTATRSDGKRQTGRPLEGVHATRADDRLFTDWTVRSASTDPRMPVAMYDLASLTEAQKVTLCSVTVGSRINLSSLPTQLPTTLGLVVEGIEETISETSWAVTFKTSPGSTSQPFIIGDSVAGVIGSGYRISPF